MTLYKYMGAALQYYESDLTNSAMRDPHNYFLKVGSSSGQIKCTSLVLSPAVTK